MEQALALYDAMLSAISVCDRVDEVKDIADKAAALRLYYRQAGNREAEQQAANVRLRASRRIGELLAELARAQGTRNDFVQTSDKVRSPFADALFETGISRQDASRFQKLAEVPQDEFEQALATGPATTESIIAKAKVGKSYAVPPPRVSDDALAVWGILRDFERSYLTADPSELLDGMTERMVEDVIRLAPLVAGFLSTLEENANVDFARGRNSRDAENPCRDGPEESRVSQLASSGGV